MDYTDIYWVELLALVPVLAFPIIAFLDIVVCQHRDYLDPPRGVYTFIAFVVMVGFSIVLPLVTGICLPNTSDDARCEMFLENCDKDNFTVELDWPTIAVFMGEDVVFPAKVRRNSANYWNDVQQKRPEIEKIINDVLRKGLEGSEQ